MTAGGKFRVLLLAGHRANDDVVARSEGVGHKSLITVGGKPILDRILTILQQSDYVRDITLIAEPNSSITEADFVDTRLNTNALGIHPAERSPALSLMSLLASQTEGSYPFLVVTSDAAMLDHAIFNDFCSGAAASPSDIVVGFATEHNITKTLPHTKRTYLRFADGGFAGCNLFALNTPNAKNAILFWVRAEQYRKHPWRLASTFGPGLLLSLTTRRWPLKKALYQIGNRLNVNAEPHILPFARAAVDVDSFEDLALVRQLWEAQ